MSNTLQLTGHDLTLRDLAMFEAQRPRVELAAAGRSQMQASLAAVEKVAATGLVRYGINTGFGAFARTRIEPGKLIELQYNLVRSHSVGVGEPFAPDIVRRIMLLKANSLAVGCSGIRPEVVDTLLALLNADVVPVIPSRGSVGASGDLAPLAHLALVLIGEGEAVHDGRVLHGAEVLTAAGREPVTLQAKEGLALLNGTQASAALAIGGLLRAETLLAASIAIGALTVEALAGSYTPFDARIHEVRRMPGQIAVAEQFRSLLTGSEIWESHRDCGRVQDPYSVRCMPQVLGAARDTFAHAADKLALEIDSVSDNPLIFGTDVLSGGNFHAEPIAMLADFMAIATAEIGGISERRSDLLVRQVNPNLTMFVTVEPGLESGFMIAQVAAAALASENKTLAHPASVDSISTSAGQEDHVSMATWAGIKLNQLAGNVARILAIEWLTASAAIDAQRPLKTTPALERLHALARRHVPPHKGDRRLDRDIAALADVIERGELTALLPQYRSLLDGNS
ncbi:MAG TPA: histidine ammonia-lyase [Gammaproteobacteria bacterium]|nr:histidine ammonia-lyase [Gammaproteobacteria bacterium]